MNYEITHLLCFRFGEFGTLFGDIIGESGFRMTWHLEHRYDVPALTVLHPLHFQSATTPCALPGDRGFWSRIQSCKSSYRCERQTRRLQLGQTIEPPSVSFLSQPGTGQFGVFGTGLQPRILCEFNTEAGSSLDRMRIVVWQLGQITTFCSVVETGQLCASGVLWSRQK